MLCVRACMRVRVYNTSAHMCVCVCRSTAMTLLIIIVITTRSPSSPLKDTPTCVLVE